MVNLVNRMAESPLGQIVFLIVYFHIVVFGIWGLWLIGSWIYHSEYLVLQVSSAILLFVAFLFAGMHSPGPD